MNNDQILALQEQGFTRGLAEAMTSNNAAFPLRIWIVDNSGSMSTNDGSRIIQTHANVKMVECTRWFELQETVVKHARLAGVLQAPTVFRLLNDPVTTQQQFSIAEQGEDCIPNDVKNAIDCINKSSPQGTTPLTDHVAEIRANVLEMEPCLKEKGQKVAIVIATDGLPNNRTTFVEALQSLEGLPVWIVIRLCTDDEKVVDYYNNLDSQLELSLEVLDDWEMEAKEVYEHNKFLNYTLPLHRCREMGYHHRIFDLLDERKLTLDELREFLVLLFGEKEFDAVPDPQIDWKGFMKAVTKMVEQEQYHWNPINHKVQPIINVTKLNKAYGGGLKSFFRLARH